MKFPRSPDAWRQCLVLIRSMAFVVCISNAVGAYSVPPTAPAAPPPPAGQQQQQLINNNAPIQPQPISANQLQAQLLAIQAQAQRQLSQLNGLMMNAANSGNASANQAYGTSMVGGISPLRQNVLETLSSVGKAIQQQLNNHVHIVTSPPNGQSSLSGNQLINEPANSKKNEYQSIVTTDQGSSLQPSGGAAQLQQMNVANNSTINYREQGEQLRQEIVKRVGQLQQVVASSLDLMKNNGDVIVRRLLEQMNARLDLAKIKAERIISEPTSNEMAIRALATINLGLNNLNNIISNIVTRLELAAKDSNGNSGANQQPMQRIASPSSSSLSLSSPLVDPNKFKFNLQQLGQQFQSVLNNSQLHQQLFNRQMRPTLLSQQSMPTVNGATDQQQQQQQNKINLDFMNQQQQQKKN